MFQKSISSFKEGERSAAVIILRRAVAHAFEPRFCQTPGISPGDRSVSGPASSMLGALRAVPRSDAFGMEIGPRFAVWVNELSYS